MKTIDTEQEQQIQMYRALPGDHVVDDNNMILAGEDLLTSGDVCITCTACGQYHSIYIGCSSVVSGWQGQTVAMRHTFADVCPQCGRRVSMASHLCDMGSGGTSPVEGHPVE